MHVRRKAIGTVGVSVRRLNVFKHISCGDGGS